MKPPFKNRAEAGQLLASRLLKYAGQPGVVVLGVPPGGMTVAHEVARRLEAPLDVLVVRPLAVPCQERLTMGAIAPGGICVLNDEVIDLLDIEGDAIGVVRRREEQELELRDRTFHHDCPRREVRGKTVIVIDDGITVGCTMHAAIAFLHQLDASGVVVAAPVIAQAAFRELQSVALEVVAVSVPEQLENVGQCFADFTPPTDDEVRWCLEAAASSAGQRV